MLRATHLLVSMLWEQVMLSVSAQRNTRMALCITSRSSSAFQWLAANASRFGFYNLPSEPWHWSTTGG